MKVIDPNGPASEEGIFGLPFSPEDAAVVLLPVPFDATTTYGSGTARGPDAILRASRQLDLHDVELGAPWQAGIALAPAHPEISALNDEARMAVRRTRESGDSTGPDASRVNAACERLNALVEAEVGRHLAAGKLVGTVGGDHGAVFGAIRAHAAHHGPFGVLHVDAHADLRCAYEGFRYSHASIMDNVCTQLTSVERLVQVGVRDLCDEEVTAIEASGGRIRTHYDAALAAARLEGVTWAAQVAAAIADLPEEVYISFDIDGLDPALCPNTGTPVPGGLTFHEACYLIRALAKSGRRIIGFDLVEVAPGAEGGEWDGNVGARLLYKLVGWALHSRAP